MVSRNCVNRRDLRHPVIRKRKSIIPTPFNNCTDKRHDMAEYHQENPDKPDKRRDELKGKVLRLKDLVNYNEGTVASRMIISRTAGSITIFSFDENEGLSEHTAPFDAVVSILEGECEVWVAGQTSVMKEGETIIFPANIPHALSAITRFKMSLTMIRG
jgi:quercetin dioxygenase-like cupin family protein